MFSQGVIGSSKNVPQWILDLVDEVEAWYGFCTDGIYFKEAKSSYRGGCYRPSEKYLQYYFGREKTIERVWVVLHELAHAWQHLECPETLTPKPKGRRNRVVHNEAFFKFACELYKRFGGDEVVEWAANNEYKRGRKYMVL
jgi:Zn-dependent peptidase ImmA (M78 family)